MHWLEGEIWNRVSYKLGTQVVDTFQSTKTKYFLNAIFDTFNISFFRFETFL